MKTVKSYTIIFFWVLISQHAYGQIDDGRFYQKIIQLSTLVQYEADDKFKKDVHQIIADIDENTVFKNIVPHLINISKSPKLKISRLIEKGRMNSARRSLIEILNKYAEKKKEYLLEIERLLKEKSFNTKWGNKLDLLELCRKLSNNKPFIHIYKEFLAGLTDPDDPLAYLNPLREEFERQRPFGFHSPDEVTSNFLEAMLSDEKKGILQKIFISFYLFGSRSSKPVTLTHNQAHRIFTYTNKLISSLDSHDTDKAFALIWQIGSLNYLKDINKEERNRIVDQAFHQLTFIISTVHLDLLQLVFLSLRPYSQSFLKKLNLQKKMAKIIARRIMKDDFDYFFTTSSIFKSFSPAIIDEEVTDVLIDNLKSGDLKIVNKTLRILGESDTFLPNHFKPPEIKLKEVQADPCKTICEVANNSLDLLVSKNEEFYPQGLHQDTFEITLNSMIGLILASSINYCPKLSNKHRIKHFLKSYVTYFIVDTDLVPESSLVEKKFKYWRNLLSNMSVATAYSDGFAYLFTLHFIDLIIQNKLFKIETLSKERSRLNHKVAQEFQKYKYTNWSIYHLYLLGTVSAIHAIENPDKDYLADIDNYVRNRPSGMDYSYGIYNKNSSNYTTAGRGVARNPAVTAIPILFKSAPIDLGLLGKFIEDLRQFVLYTPMLQSFLNSPTYHAGPNSFHSGYYYQGLLKTAESLQKVLSRIDDELNNGESSIHRITTLLEIREELIAYKLVLRTDLLSLYDSTNNRFYTSGKGELWSQSARWSTPLATMSLFSLLDKNQCNGRGPITLTIGH